MPVLESSSANASLLQLRVLLRIVTYSITTRYFSPVTEREERPEHGTNLATLVTNIPQHSDRVILGVRIT